MNKLHNAIGGLFYLVVTVVVTVVVFGSFIWFTDLLSATRYPPVEIFPTYYPTYDTTVPMTLEQARKQARREMMRTYYYDGRYNPPRHNQTEQKMFLVKYWDMERGYIRFTPLDTWTNVVILYRNMYDARVLELMGQGKR